MNIFLSHISEESSEANGIKTSLESALPGIEIFVSAADIHYGDQWLKVIDEAMERAKVILSLCSPGSVRRSWVNFESGSGWARRIPVIPLCYKGLTKDQLPDPLGIFQALELTNANACLKLAERLALEFKIRVTDNFDPSLMLESMKPKPPVRKAEIGIVLTHRQDQWEQYQPTVFNLSEKLPPGISVEWKFQALTDKKSFLSEDLNKLTGLVFTSPWRTKLEPEIIASTVEWVKKGGRLLLLGFELGDRHHGANLAELSQNFGIHPFIDIVGPPDFGQQKPYETIIEFDTSITEKHPFTNELTCIQLANVQTLRVEPGGIEWLRVGKNVVYQPKRESVIYRDGVMTAPGGNAFHLNKNAGWLPVAVEAPKGLCGQGSVQMIGTWDLIGRNLSFGDDNNILVTRLLDWLAAK
ncbi:MAG TPA: toll/interleukin-1 receptor domain-containing protein [Draconibacterium sp.]|nr:toll/interleukin-1 receptor domain-containing protein [Draconibacterium sp.]